MNINIRTNEYFTNQYIRLCKSQGTNQTDLFVHLINRLIYHIAICNESTDEALKQRSRYFLYAAGIHPQGTEDVIRYNK